MSTGGKIDTVLMGDGSLLIQCGDVLRERGHVIKAIVTASDQVTAWACKHGIHTIAPDGGLPQSVAGLAYDWFFSIANLRIVPDSVWQRASKGAVNFHDGPLPRHAGLNAPAWALLEGERTYGVTWHAITSAIDEGDIFAQSLFDISADETSISLNTKCFEAGISTFLELLEAIENGKVTRLQQDLSSRSYHERLKRPARAATIDFTRTTEEIGRLGRALSFGAGYANPLALPKLWSGSRAYNVPSLAITTWETPVPAGTVISVDVKAAFIACADGMVQIKDLTDERGRRIALSAVLQPGQVLEPLPEATARAVDASLRDLARNDAFFERRLRLFQNLELFGIAEAGTSKPADWQSIDLAMPTEASSAQVLAALLAGLSRMTDQDQFSLLLTHDRHAALQLQQPGYVTDALPFDVDLSAGLKASEFAERIKAEVTDLMQRAGVTADLVSRRPRLAFPDSTLAVCLTADVSAGQPVAGTAITFVVAEAGGACRAMVDAGRLPISHAKAIMDRLAIASEAFAANDSLDIAQVPMMTPSEEVELLRERNATQREYDRTALVHGLIETQVNRTPDAIAVVCGDESLSYKELDEKAGRVAKRLIADGVGPDTMVGLHLSRSCDLVVGALAILKAGGAYVPLDPNYPADRLALMIEDSGLQILIADSARVPLAQSSTLKVLTIEAALSGDQLALSTPSPVRPENLAYVIYTSGSTGRPKGVMLEHRNVVNFFAGMDDRVPYEAGHQPVWLAVTSLSFDISVLELLWTLARGFKVVIYRDVRTAHAATRITRAPGLAGSNRPLGFGLFYWGDDDSQGADKYRLLLEGARFADERGFQAVWTPERHFHAFGGPYPNPAVTGAAVAAITRNVSIRAGSCVLPLHHPARIAEEWAVIDNISRGRVALAFASGWMPEDFLLRPENAPPNNKAAMLRDIEVVRRLWRGEKVGFPAPGGKLVEVTTLPRPVQPELPAWLTTAGNADTFREAARLGLNVLTHLLGQSIAEVGEKIKIYREALVAHGRDPSKFTVTLMLHTLIGQDREAVREIARGPMTRYLRSAAALIKEYAWAFPAFKRPSGVDRPMDIDLKTLEPEEFDAIIEFAFLRYFDDSGLFGTVDDAIARTNQLSAIGVDEIACLIDFGVPTEVALAALHPLAEVVAAWKSSGSQPAAQPETVGDLIGVHGATHFQCTPAMATMLLASDRDRAALRNLHHIFVGGEALQNSLLKDLLSATGASVENMYGPTETTIWSSTGPALDTGGTVPLGTPIANTQLYVLDSRLRPVPKGVPGELYIGGDGVARGYHRRDELTLERFLPNPFLEHGRIYRTGDVVRIGEDGALHYLGRTDHQVKVRGYRIELGEIESCLGQHPDVAQSVVVAREDVAGDVRIVAYMRFKSANVSEDDLKRHARSMLPDFMIPAHFVTVDRFPLTPNAKIDRKALPRPNDAAAVAPAVQYAAPDTETARQIADVFKRILGVERVGLNDNFFDLGGHSLLAVQAHRNIKAEIAPALSITDIYRFPTIAGLVNHLREKDGPNRRLDTAAARAAQRRSAIAGRRL